MTFLRDAVAGGFHHEEEALAFGGQPRTVKMRGAANIVDEAVGVHLGACGLAHGVGFGEMLAFGPAAAG